MLNRLFGFEVHSFLHFVGALILVIGLPFNKVLMSIGSIWLVANLLLEGNYKAYWELLKTNVIFVFVAVLFLFHVFGVFYSENSMEALSDVRTKLPLLSIPLGLIAKPLEKKYIRLILGAFLSMLLLTSILNVVSFFVTGGELLGDLRYMSRFGSHIRYGLLISFGAAISLHYVFFEKATFKFKIIGVALFLWFSYYTLLSQVGSATLSYLAVLISSLFIHFSYLNHSWSRKIGAIGLIGVLAGLISVGFSFFGPVEHNLNKTDLDKYSLSGNVYYHDLSNSRMERGSPVFVYIVDEEVQEIWNQRSQMDFSGKDKKGHTLKNTLYRYLTSKGLRKDKEGMLELTDDDILHVENGIASFYQRPGSSWSRLEEFRSELHSYQAGASPDGNSVLQRLEFWNVAFELIKENWLFGVGNGDIIQEMNRYFNISNSNLSSHLWDRPHNQFISFWVAFGIFGLITFLILCSLLFHRVVVDRNWVGFFFVLIMVMSCMTEDTLETQQGVTFVGFFIGFLPFLKT